MHRFATFCTLLTISLLPTWAQQDIITTAIGGGPNGIPAVQSDLSVPYAVALDASGNYYITAGSRVYKVDTGGTLTVVAGTGVLGDTGDGVPGGAANAELSTNGIAVDSASPPNVYFSDYNDCVIRKIDATNTITTIAGVPGHCTFNQDGPATNSYLNQPHDLALDTSGDLYIADSGNNRIRKLALATDTISTVAGTGTAGYSGDGNLATLAKLNNPYGVAIDGAGDIFIADTNNYRIREVAFSTGIITTFAGNGSEGNTSAEMGYVYNGLAVNTAGTTVTFGDITYNEIRQFTVGGDITTIAGNGKAGFSGDAGLATLAEMKTPRGIVIASSGAIYFSDAGNNRVRQFTIGGDIGTVAGNGDPTFPTLVSGVPPQGVVLNDPIDVLEDPSGNVFISEQANCTVRELVKATGLVNIFAGTVASNATTGTCGFSLGSGPATSAELGTLSGLARDTSGNIYIADTKNCLVWQVSASTSDISIFVGIPKSCGYSGDGGPPTSAELDAPAGIFIDSNNNLYIADSTDNRIREVTGGTINTIAGNGTAGYLGDGDPATIAELHDPTGVAVDSAGNVYIADYDNCVIREVTAATGIINTIAGIGTSCGYNGDGPATEHELNHPNRIHLDANDNLFIGDDNSNRVRWVNPAGLMTTIAGNGTAGLSGDGGPATNAELNAVGGIAQDASGNFLVADYNNLRIREVSVFSALGASASNLDFGLVTVGSTGTPQTLTLSAIGPLTFSDISITGPFTEYDDCGAGLSNAATCTMYVLFKPTAGGTETGAIAIEDNGFFTDTASISLEGTGNAISVTGGPLVFGSEAVGSKSAAKTVTVANKGTASVTMGAITVDETDFAITANKCPVSGSPLAAGTSCTVSVIFQPKATGVKKGALVVNDSDPSSPQVVGVTGTGTSSVTLTPSPLAFAATPVGTINGPTMITLKNNTTATLTLKSPALSVAGPFTISGITTCTAKATVVVGATCAIWVNFAPTSAGYPTGTLSVFDSDATSPQTVALSGIATGVEFTPSPVTLTSTAVGIKVSQSVNIINVGTSTITFTAGTIVPSTYSNNFSTTATDPPCAGNGSSLAPGQSCSFTVYYTPSTSGAESATYLVYDSSTGSPQPLILNGTVQ
jgi:sugar lactone lactonase YvrE